MSSEAAYFPETLANASDNGEPRVALPVRSASRSGSASTLSEGVDEERDASDELLLLQIKDGDKGALGTLFRRHAHAVRRLGCRILQNEAEADDLLQEVFLAIFRNAALYKPTPGRARSWILHLAYHKALDRRRYLTFRQYYAAEELEGVVYRLADPRRELPFDQSTLEGILGKSAMAEFRSRLSAEQQQTLELFFFEGYVLREIAELTGRSLEAVRSHYYRGLERLRQIVLAEKPQPK